MASACSSAGATPGAGGNNGGGGAGASGAAAGAASAAFNPSDPESIITAVVSGESAVKSFHINLSVNGTIKSAALADAAGGAGGAAGALKGDLKLDGTSIDGDVDLANLAAHLTVNVPPLAALGNQPVTGDLIVKDNALYYKVSLLGPKYTKMDLGSLASLASSLPVSVPTANAAASAALVDQVNQIRTAMQQAGVKATLVGVDQIGGKDAYHINISIPIDYLNSQIAAQASAGPAMKIDSAAVDFWVYKDGNRLAKAEIKGASSALGNIDITLTITNYDQPVTVTAPAAGDITPSK
jgi:hypothetical protein